MFIFFICCSTTICHFNAQTVTCKLEQSPCNCPTSSTSCVLDCGRQTDACKGATLNCRDADSCIIQCDAIATCSDYVVINAETAKDVTIICDATDACKVGIDIKCGTGDCELQCNTEKSCSEFGTIDVTASSSFHCTGNYCPNGIPSSFTTSPTSHPIYNHTSDPTETPTSNPSSNPIIFPSSIPTNDPSSNPAFTPTLIDSILPSITPTKSTTKNPSSHPISVTESTVVAASTTNNPTSIPTVTLPISVTESTVVAAITTNNPTSTSYSTLSPSNIIINTLNIDRLETDDISENNIDAITTTFYIPSANSAYYMIGILISGCCYVLIAFCFCFYFKHKYSEKRKHDICNNASPECNKVPSKSPTSINPQIDRLEDGEVSLQMVDRLEDGEVSLQMVDNDNNAFNPLSLMGNHFIDIAETVTFHYYPNKPSQICIPPVAYNQFHSVNDAPPMPHNIPGVDQSPIDDSNHTDTVPAIPPGHGHLDNMNRVIIPIPIYEHQMEHAGEHETQEGMDVIEDIASTQHDVVYRNNNVHMIDVISVNDNLDINENDDCNISISHMSKHSGNEIV